MKRIRISLAILLPALLVGCNRANKTSDPGILAVNGRIDGDTVDIAPKRQGRITEISVREGDPVEAGQVVAQIVSLQDNSQVEARKADVLLAERRLEEALAAAPARVSLAEANLAASQADLVRSEAELAQAEKDAKRYPPLVPTGAIAEQTSEQEQTKLKVAQAANEASHKEVLAAQAALDQAKAQMEQINTAKANLASSRAQLVVDQENVNDLTIPAPIKGTILTRSAEPGRVVEAGQTILTMIDPNRLYLRAYVPEGEIGKVKNGQKAQVFLDSNPNEAIPAEVVRTDPQPMFTPENIYFKDDRVNQMVGVKIELQGAYGVARPGMPASGRIEVGTQ